MMKHLTYPHGPECAHDHTKRLVSALREEVEETERPMRWREAEIIARKFSTAVLEVWQAFTIKLLSSLPEPQSPRSADISKSFSVDAVTEKRFTARELEDLGIRLISAGIPARKVADISALFDEGCKFRRGCFRNDVLVRLSKGAVEHRFNHINFPDFPVGKDFRNYRFNPEWQVRVFGNVHELVPVHSEDGSVDVPELRFGQLESVLMVEDLGGPCLHHHCPRAVLRVRVTAFVCVGWCFAFRHDISPH